MGNPKDLSLGEIRNYMLLNNCKVTNHALVKHFKQFLTNPDTQIEARKQFKTFVNILSTIKNENNEKYLILRKKYVNEAPPEDLVHNSSAPMSPDARSVISDGEQSPFRPNQPPPYRHPPEFSPTFGTPPPPVAKAVPVLTNPQYKECVDEFKTALTVLEGRMQPQGSIDSQSSGNSRKSSVDVADTEPPPPVLPPRRDRQLSRENSSNNNSEKIDAIKESVVIEKSESVVEDNKENDSQDNNDNKISVKEATRKFNRYASVEEAKVPSPLGKKKPDKDLEESQSAENLLQHPKAKEWLLSAARSNYQDLAKLAQEHPKLVKVQDPNTGYTALHWAAKHGNVDVVKLIAGSYRADVNSTTNGGYTALHLAMQFGRNDIFELLCNVYKADRDCMDYSGKKPLDYQKQMTSVSESTYSSKYRTVLDWPTSDDSSSFSPLANFGSLRKGSRRQRRSIISVSEPLGVQRSYSIISSGSRTFNPRGFMKDKTVFHYTDNTSNNNDQSDEVSSQGGSLAGGSFRLRRNDKRHKSFLRKTFGPSSGRSFAEN